MGRKKKTKIEFAFPKLGEHLPDKTLIKIATEKGSGFHYFGTVADLKRDYGNVDTALECAYTMKNHTSEGYVELKKRKVINIIRMIQKDESEYCVVIEGTEDGPFWCKLEYEVQAIEANGMIFCRRMYCPAYRFTRNRRLEKPCEKWREYVRSFTEPTGYYFC